MVTPPIHCTVSSPQTAWFIPTKREGSSCPAMLRLHASKPAQLRPWAPGDAPLDLQARYTLQHPATAHLISTMRLPPEEPRVEVLVVGLLLPTAGSTALLTPPPLLPLLMWPAPRTAPLLAPLPVCAAVPLLRPLPALPCSARCSSVC